MKVLMLNGSPHANGCTFTALDETARRLEKNGIETEIVHVGKEAVRGCAACGFCAKNGRCVFDDIVNETAPKFEQADGLVIGSPVYYASANATLIAVLDRLFYSTSFDKTMKVGAAVLSARRGGITASFDELNKYFTINSMPIVSSQYWNQVHGNTPEEVMKDEEGMQTMRTLGKNMAWLIKCIELGKQNGIEIPPQEAKIMTNFIN